MQTLAEITANNSTRIAKYNDCENYYNGEQNAKLTTRQRNYLYLINDNEFAENVTRIIVNALSNKLTIKGFTVENENAGKVKQVVEQLGSTNNVLTELSTAISKTIEIGDGAIIVDWDVEKEKPIINFSHPKNIVFNYNAETRQLDSVVKHWKTKVFNETHNPNSSEIIRVNIYYNNRVEKYFCLSDGEPLEKWLDYYDENNNIVWPMPWTTDKTFEGEPLGIPIFHLKNNPRGGFYGNSEITPDLMVAQNSLNKLWLDLFQISDDQAFPQRWAVGINADANLTGGPGTVWRTSQSDGKFGQFDAADLKQLIETLTFRYRTISATYATPLSELVRAGATNQSGESIKQVERPLVEKAKNRKAYISEPIENAIILAIKLVHYFRESLPQNWVENPSVKILWEPIEHTDEKEILEHARIKKELGVPMEIILSELGYDNIEEILSMINAEKDASDERLIRQINRGDLPTV